MLVTEFRAFLTKSNALALAVGVIIGAAVGNVVTALVGDILMPVISRILPSGDWRSAKWVISGSNAVLYGHFAGVVLDFVIIAFIVFILTKALLRPEPAPPTKACPQCLETVPKAATRCRACTSTL
jgi:large conductance mechanosensitive channel